LEFFEDRSKDSYLRSIANVKALGADKASEHDVEMAKRAAQQAGSMGNRAREAFDKK
jgi:hypothetical protein